MREKMIRSFFGAFVCTLLTIFPASTFNMPYLLIPGGILGWLIGYHGDRFIEGFKAAHRNAPSFKDRIQLSMKSFQNRIDKVFIFGGAITGMLSKAILAVVFFIPRAIISVVSWMKNIPSGYTAYINHHPINKAYMIRNILLLLFSIVDCYVVYKLLVLYGPAVGDPGPIALGSSTPTFNTLADVRIERGVYLLMYCAFIHMPFVMFYLKEGSKLTGFYGIWERYSRGKVQFACVEFIRILWIQIWCDLSVLFFLSYLLAGVFVGVFLLGIILMITVAGIKATWRIVKANRDYGVVSLIIGLTAGIISFYCYRDELVASMSYRLIVSVTTGAGAGLISALVTFILDPAFKNIKWLNKIAEAGEDEFFDFVFPDYWEKGLVFLWNGGKKTLPKNIYPSIA